MDPTNLSQETGVEESMHEVVTARGAWGQGGRRPFEQLRTVSSRAALAVAMAGGSATRAEAQQAVVAAPTATAASPAFEAVIRREMEATVKAFNAGDASGLAGLFMEKGELVDENGNVYTGRAEIAELFKAFFAKFPKASLDMEVTNVRAIGDSLAVEEGVRQITASEGQASARLRYVAMRDKVGDSWPIASYREFADDPIPTAAEMLEPMAFLVGDWVDENPDGRTSISYRWSEDGNFLLGEFALAAGGMESKSVQRFGWDPVEGVIRSWTFDSDGGFSQGEWTPVEAGWVSKTEATMPDGTTASATVTVTIKDQDHFLVRSSDRIVAGVEEPDFEMLIARRPPQPGAATAKPAAN